jgi:hypothetical protein
MMSGCLLLSNGSDTMQVMFATVIISKVQKNLVKAKRLLKMLFFYNTLYQYNFS